MNPPSHRLRTDLSQASVNHQQQGKQAHEFASAEDLMRADAAAAEVPAAIEQRLAQSIAREPSPGKSWWKRIFN